MIVQLMQLLGAYHTRELELAAFQFGARAGFSKYDNLDGLISRARTELKLESRCDASSESRVQKPPDPLRARSREGQHSVLTVELGLGARLGGSLWYFGLIRGDSNSFDLQPFVHIEALLAIQTLYEFSRGLANCSSDAAGIDFYCPALGAKRTVFIFQCDIVRVQGDLP